MYRQSANRLSEWTASFAYLNPLRQGDGARDTGRFPRFSAMAGVHPASRQHGTGFNPDTDVPRPISVVPTGQGGWASRFFTSTSAGGGGHTSANWEEAQGYGDGTYRSHSAGSPTPMISRSPSGTRPIISHPFAATINDENNNEGQWGQSYLPPVKISHPTLPASSALPTRDRNLLQRSPTPSSAYSGMVNAPTGPSAGGLHFPEPRRPGSDQSGIEMLATTPTNAEYTSTAGAKAAILARLNANAGAAPRPDTAISTGGDGPLIFGLNDDPHSSSLFGFDSRGVSVAETSYSDKTSLAHPSGQHAAGPSFPVAVATATATGNARDVETMYLTASSGLEPELGHAGAGARATYISAATGRETRDWYDQPEMWDETLSKNAEEAAGMQPRKSVRWGDGSVGDGIPRAL